MGVVDFLSYLDTLYLHQKDTPRVIEIDILPTVLQDSY